MSDRYTVTTALPYANGPLHLGHVAGVYIPADIYVRYLRANNKDVVFIGGTDEHGVPISIKAKNEGVSPKEIVDRYHNIIKKSFLLKRPISSISKTNTLFTSNFSLPSLKIEPVEVLSSPQDGRGNV